MTKQLIVNVDWDYFFPDISRFDLGHKETEFFIAKMWSLRAHLVDILVPSGHEVFWNLLKTVGIEPYKITISESHAHCVETVLKSWNTFPLETVMVVFDQHLDAAHRGEYVDCENWLLKLLEEIKSYGGFMTVLYVMPGFSLEEYSQIVPKKWMGWVHLMNFSQFMEYMKNEEIVNLPGFVCRSGAWTPPWCDDEFDKFVNSSGAEISYHHFLRPSMLGKGLTSEEFIENIIEGLFPRIRDRGTYSDMRKKMIVQLEKIRGVKEDA